MPKPKEFAKDAATAFFNVLDTDRDTYITPHDVLSFVRARALSFSVQLVDKMFSEAKGAYTPDGMLTLQDVKQAAGYRKERVVLNDSPNPLSGTSKAVKYEYKLRPYREQWLELASHAVPGGLIFAPSPTESSHKPSKLRSRSRTKSPQRMGSPFVVLPEDASLYIHRSKMLHGTRTDGDERMAKAATIAAQESGVVSNNGVFRRPVLEAKLNEAATHHLRSTEEPHDTTLPSTPIQVYDFSAKAAYDDVAKLIRIDSVTDEIRNLAVKEGASRQLASQSLHDMWQNNGSFAKTMSSQRTLIREGMKEGGIVLTSDKSRVPACDVSVVCAKPIQRAVDGTVILETDPYLPISSIGSPGFTSVGSESRFASLASSGYLGTGSQMMGDSRYDGGFADDGGTEFGSVYTTSRPSPDFLSGEFFPSDPPDSEGKLLDSDEPAPLFEGDRVASKASNFKHSASLTQSLVSRHSRPGSSVFSTGGASLLRPSTQSSSSLLLGASQTLQSSELRQQSSLRKKELLERQLLRISALSGRPVSAAGATLIVAHQASGDIKQQRDTTAFGFNKPQDRLHLLSRCAQEKRELHGEWKPPPTPEFRPKYEPSPKQERQNPFGYMNRVLSSEQRAKDKHELTMKTITGLSDAAFESLFAQAETGSDRVFSRDPSSSFSASFRSGLPP